MTKKSEVKPRGRAATKIKLKHNPKTSAEDYWKQYKNRGVVCIYGVDDFTKGLIDYVWDKCSTTEIVVTDPNESALDNLNKVMIERRFSEDRWITFSPDGFISEPFTDVIVVANKYINLVKTMHNPEKVKFVELEKL